MLKIHEEYKWNHHDIANFIIENNNNNLKNNGFYAIKITGHNREAISNIGEDKFIERLDII